MSNTSPLNFLIIHGTDNNPQGNWFPWLKAELEKRGHCVLAPRFPTPQHQNLTNWRKIADTALVNTPPSDTILIGHSTGSVCALRMAEFTNLPYKAVYSVCPFARDLGLADYDPLNESFVKPPFGWRKVKKGAAKIVLFAGDNDRYVPLVCSQEIADAIGTKLTIIEKGGHLNLESGYDRFPLLLNKILEG